MYVQTRVSSTLSMNEKTLFDRQHRDGSAAVPRTNDCDRAVRYDLGGPAAVQLAQKRDGSVGAGDGLACAARQLFHLLVIATEASVTRRGKLLCSWRTRWWPRQIWRSNWFWSCSTCPWSWRRRRIWSNRLCSCLTLTAHDHGGGCGDDLGGHFVFRLMTITTPRAFFRLFKIYIMTLFEVAR